ncbi:MAG: deoxyribonuclease V [Verrucomicrobia bacterium]|nr:deoxyribonuclease V [Verrucomicrobiota bacterium]
MARFRSLHSWDLSPAAARQLQSELCAQLQLTALPEVGAIQTVAGCDISFARGDDTAFAAIVVVRLPDLATFEEAGAVTKLHFPYVPGLLSFREAPPLLEAWARLRTEPDAVMLDGQGLAHPRRLGIASHLGLWLDRPTLGCAKSVLVGRYAAPGLQRGAHTPLVDRGETVGAALRTRDGTSPVFVSAGHRLDLASALALTLRCGTGKYRLPEPTRRAHLLANRMRRGEADLPLPLLD